MTDFARLTQEIEQQERWLAGAGVEGPAPGDLDEVKRRVRIAIDECWLAQQAVTPPLGDVLTTVKARIREASPPGGPAGTGPTPVAEPAGRAYRFVSTFAAAAALLLAAGLGLWSASSSLGRRASFEALDELATVMQRQTDEVEAEWVALETELTALENALASMPETTWDQTLPDTLDEEIDDLMLEVGLTPDVS
ncbi:MAG: hypothetical protein ACYSUQ_08280 [Planctomycetota bacterium]